MHIVSLAVSLWSSGGFVIELDRERSTLSDGASENLPVNAGDVRVVGSIPG